MKKGKLIIIEGTDCSGKETQSNLLVNFLNLNGYATKKFSFPNYNSATGKIIAGPYLGKKGFGEPLFNEGASNVDPYCASLLYAMDRKYNINTILNELNNGINIVLDRYVLSNMAHQASKLTPQTEEHMFYFIERLEYELLELPRPDLQIFLHMPTWATNELKKNRPEAPDQHESNTNYLRKSEQAYLKLAQKYNCKIIECTNNKTIKTINQINLELTQLVYNWMKNN